MAEETAAVVQAPATPKTTTQMTLQLKQIQEPEVALRKAQTKKEKFAEFLESVRANGVLKPILVRRVVDSEGGPDTFVICDGLQRYTAAAMVGLNEIKANVLDGVNDEDALELQIEMNNHGIKTSARDYAAGLQRILDRYPERTLNEQATRLHVSPGWLKSQLNLLHIPEDSDAAKAINAGDVGLSNAYALARLAKVRPDLVGDWLERAKNMPPDQFFPECVNEAKRLQKEAQGQKVAPSGPVEKLRRLGDIKVEAKKARETLAASPNSEFAQGYQYALEWVLQVDPASQEAWKEEQKLLAEEKAAKAAEKEAKKAAEGTAPAKSSASPSGHGFKS